MIDTTKLITGSEYLIYIDGGTRDVCVWYGSDFEGDRGHWEPSEVVSVYGPISKETLPLVASNPHSPQKPCNTNPSA